jgi:hypothetical protein
MSVGRDGTTSDYVARAGPGRKTGGQAKRRGKAETSMTRARFAELCADDTNPSPTRLYAVTRARGPGPSAGGAAVPGGTLAPECLTRCAWARGFCSSQRSCPGCPGARDAVGRAVRQGAVSGPEASYTQGRAPLASCGTEPRPP